MPNTARRNWIFILFAIILISPLFNIPRPTNVSSIPWRVELLFSLAITVLLALKLRDEATIRAQNEVFFGGPLRPLLLPIVLFTLWSGISTVWSSSTTAAVHHTLVWANYLFVFAITAELTTNAQGRSKIIFALSAIAILLGLIAGFDFLTIVDFSAQEGALRIRYAKFAEMVVTIAPLLFSVALIVKSRRSLAGALTVASLAWITVMLSLSKGAFIAGAVGVGFLFGLVLIFKKQQRRRVALIAAVWLCMTIGFQFGVSYFTAIPSTADYISGSHQRGPSTSDMRVFTWKVAFEMFRTSPIAGVGADNFGLAFNEARTSFARSDPHDPGSAIGEDYVFERAHNEFLQVAAELGVVGLALFGSAFCVLLYSLLSAIRRYGRQLSPMFYGSLAGLVAFFVSSMVSSFSFRAYQNGSVFFVVAGFAVSYLCRRTRTACPPTAEYRMNFKLVGIFAAITLFVFSFSKATSQYLLFAGERTADLGQALSFYAASAGLDPDNPGAELAAAEALVRDKRWAEAVPHFRRTIDRGFGVSVVYSYLANAQEMSGDLNGAEQSLREASNIFPRSTFVMVRRAIVLEKLGRFEDAAEQINVARSIDMRQTNGWYSVIKDGILKAHLKATAEPDNFAAPPALLPENAIHAYNDEKVRID